MSEDNILNPESLQNIQSLTEQIQSLNILRNLERLPNTALNNIQ